LAHLGIPRDKFHNLSAEQVCEAAEPFICVALPSQQSLRSVSNQPKKPKTATELLVFCFPNSFSQSPLRLCGGFLAFCQETQCLSLMDDFAVLTVNIPLLTVHCLLLSGGTAAGMAAAAAVTPAFFSSSSIMPLKASNVGPPTITLPLIMNVGVLSTPAWTAS
jgi:hypothetical protein